MARMELSGVRVTVMAADPTLRNQLQELASRLGHQVTCADLGPDGTPDLAQQPEVLLWAPWPGDGCAAQPVPPLRHSELARVGVLALCPGGDEQRHEALQSGADGTLAHIDAGELRDALAGLSKLILLRRTMEEGAHAGITGVLQPASFQRALDAEFLRLERYPGVLSLVAVLVDPGPATGQEHLDLQIGEALRRGLRGVDLAARLEEDGFALLLPLTDAAAARKAAHRIQRLVRALVLRPAATSGMRALAGLIKCTASLGVATFPSAGVQGMSQLLQRARQAATHAAECGGDCVVYHDGEQFLTAQVQGGSGG